MALEEEYGVIIRHSRLEKHVRLDCLTCCSRMCVLVIPSTILARFRGISDEFGQAMVLILRHGSLRPNESHRVVFRIECRKTKTKVITVSNHKGHKQSS